MASDPGLAQVYRRFAGSPAAGTLHHQVALALAGSPEALRAIGPAPARGRHPTQILAALHHLALAGRAPALAAAYASGDAAGPAAVDVLVRHTDAVVALAVRRRVRPDETGRHAVLHPAVAEAAHRLGADAVGLVDIGRPAGLNLAVDRVGISYDDGRRLGDPSSPVQVTCRVVGGRSVPARGMPEVVVRIGLDTDPLDVTDPDDDHWLRACLPPDQRERAAALDAEMALLAADPPVLLRGDLVELLLDAVGRVPADVLPVVTTTWALSRIGPERRRQFVRALGDAGRPVAWVSAEGVGVAPTIPTLGDRPASGHSILGLAMFQEASSSAEVLGRCWSRGRVLSWLAEAQAGSSSVA